ncbi:MAG: hypothetical protein JRG96_04400 [Deltaproteobacteria bacterium]|nr:hypothetical protein [Deltaproteobacteria bacterium]MBW2417504.1 hypothetical protein [Deltaproteobacteria bacterium]
MKERWLIAQSIDGERDFVVHLETPRFVVEIPEGDADLRLDGNILMIDEVPSGDADGLLREAAEAFSEWERRLEEEAGVEEAGDE